MAAEMADVLIGGLSAAAALLASAVLSYLIPATGVRVVSVVRAAECLGNAGLIFPAIVACAYIAFYFIEGFPN